MPTATPSRVETRTARRQHRQRRRSLRNRLLAFLLAPALVVGGVSAGIWGVTAASAAALPAPTATLALQDTGGAHGDADPKPFILAGEDATFDVSLTNASPTGGGFNIAFTLTVPNGTSFVSSPMGTPVIYSSGATLPNSSKTPPLATVPAGVQLWVFEDVADLPATADYASTITVRPDAAVFPVGAVPGFELQGYVSSVASLKPIFDGSTGRGGSAALVETSSDTAVTTVPVRALRLTKTEPSPEIELLRGVHDHQTVYTLTVENTPQGATDGVTVVDYLPAGLEFLGCADVDNTRDSALLYGAGGALGGSLEYPGAGPITGAAPADCFAPVSVETVDTGIPADLPAGVYTKVTWEIPPLSGTTAQAFPSAAGTPGVTTIRYAAAVPLFENTMDFVTADGSGTPSAASGAQGANLNNNTGASTRQGQGAGFGDGIEYRNAATVAGTYAGPVAGGASTSVTDTDTEVIQAMDLRVLKSVDTGSGGNEFVTGGLATFTLDLATSEYTSADQMVVTDVIPNGLCPALPSNGALLTGDAWPSDCANPSPAPGATLTGATVTSIDYDQVEGEFTITFLPEPDLIAENGTHPIVYTVLMRAQYTDRAPYVGATSSGDSLTNIVEVEGWTHSVPALAGVTNGSGVPAFGDEDVWDDSSAEIVSGYSQIGKRVLARDAVIDTAPAAPTAADSCLIAPSDAAWDQNQTDPADTPFVPGDAVCYELTVDYATQIDVRNALVTDFLPSGVAFAGWDLYEGPGGTTGITDADIVAAQDGQRLDFAVGAPGADGDRFVPLGSKLVLHILGTVTSWTPNDEASLDKPENLMKYQQENVLGDVFFLRTASAIQTGQGPSLLKGVRDVDGDATLPARSQANADGTVFDSNRDGIAVVQGDVVTYRVDLTGGTSDAEDVVVWDALPSGILSADVSAPGATVVDPGDAGYPASLPAAYTGRSVVIWTGIDVAAAAQVTLTYSVTIPDDALVNTDYPNTASITQYDLPLNTGGANTVYPTDSLDDRTHPEEQTVPGVGTRDDSDVFTPDPEVDKALVSTEVSPVTANLDPTMNDVTQAVQGELITYEYSVEIPANTSVANGVLRDRGTLTPGNVPFTATAGSWTASALTGATTADFGFEVTPATGDARGLLTFPASYRNSSNTAQVFTVTLTGYVGDAGANNTTLTNQAQFASSSWSGNDTAQVVYREPNLDIVKTASKTEDVVIGEPVTYALTVSNGPNRVKSYDNVVTDTVPVGLVVDTSTFSPAPVSFDLGIATGAGGQIVWNLAEVPATASLTYVASISPLTGAGTSYTNVAVVDGYTLPSSLGNGVDDRRGERSDTDDAVIEAVTAGIAKGVRVADPDPYTDTVSAPIGQTVQYEVQATLRANINYYGVRLTDALPAGAQLVASSVAGPTASSPTIDGVWTRSLDAGTNTWTWTYDRTIASEPFDRTLTLTYDVLLSDAIADSAATLPNTAGLSWTTVDGDESTRTTIDDDASVTVLDPVPAIEKTVSNGTPDPGEAFEYTVEVTNTGNTPAYNLVVTDTIPDGVVVDASTISNGGTLAGQTATGGGTITWDAADLPGPLHQQGSSQTPTTIELTYSAVLAASSSLGDDETFTNTARVTHLESFPAGGRAYDPTTVEDTAVVDPAFPNLTLTKTTTASDVATAGTPFGWTLSLVNDGDGAADTVAVTDVLPKNWTFDAGSAQVRIGETPIAALADPTVTTVAGVQTLTWPASAISAATPVLPGTASGATPAQRTITVTFTATPTTAALTDAGVTTSAGVHIPHVNTLSATTTDTSGATGNESGSYTGPDDTADAYLHSADVVLVKDPGAGLVAGGPAGTAWTITVSNVGPDPAAGPITVDDDWGTLPDGFTVTGVTGAGWSCDAPTASGFSCERTDPTESIAAGASLPVLTVAAQAAASFDPAAAPVPNEATATSSTFDPDTTNNTDDAEVPVTTSADLRIAKTGPSTVPNAGGPINWSIVVTNDGPSDSLSETGDLITVTDTIPVGVDGVTVGTLPTGWTSSATGPLNAGDTLTLTLDAGQRLATLQSASFTLSGTVSPSLVPGTEIENTAVVEPGTTTDPDPSNNTSTTPEVTPTTDTTLGVTKTRQVFEGGAWRDATSADETVPGDPVTYLVSVANTGTADARDVTLVDEVPTYLAYASFESVTGTWTRTSTTAAPGDDQSFDLDGDLAAAATASLRITLNLDAAYDDEVVNWVQADAENSTNSPRDSDGSDSTRSANLSIVKSHTGTARAGETLPYLLSVTNEGPSYSSGPIVVTDTLPAGFGYEAGSATVAVAGGAATPVEPVVVGQTLTWTIGDSTDTLANGDGIVVDFTATVDAAVPAGTYDNVGTVDGPDDTDPSDDTWTDPTEVTTWTALTVVKTAAPGPYVAGQPVVFTVDVTNEGPSVARDVAVRDLVPTGMSVTGMSGTDWTCDIAEAVCRTDVLPVGTSSFEVVVTIAASVPQGTDLTNVVTATTSTPGSGTLVTGEDDVSVVATADLALTKTAIDADGAEIVDAIAGTDVRYRLEVVNNGPSDAVGPLRIVDALPEGLTFVAIAEGAGAWTCEPDPAAAGEIVCTTPGGLPTGQRAADLVVIAAIDAGQPVGSVTNTATVSSPTDDPVPSNNTDDAVVEIVQSADLSIVKSHDAADVRVGDELTFGLEVRNDGPSLATGVQVVDVLPAGLAYVGAGATDPAWTVTAADVADDGTTTVTAVLAGSIDAGGVAPTLEITTLVQAAAYPSVVNTATVTGVQPDPDPSDNTSEDTVTVPALATLVLEKTLVGELQVGSEGTYRLTLTNTGPTEDPGPITIEDALPSGLSFRSATADGADCAQTLGVVTCEVQGALAVGASVTIDVLVAVQHGAYPQVTNTAEVQTPTAQTPDAQLTSSVTSPVQSDPLPATGGPVATLAVILGVLLALLGSILLAMRRRVTV